MLDVPTNGSLPRPGGARRTAPRHPVRPAGPPRPGRLAALLGAVACVLLALVPRARAAHPAVLQIAIQPDMPPYVMNGARDGLEVDIVRDALPGHTIHFIQMPGSQLEKAVPEKRAAAAVGVTHFPENSRGVFYSQEFITFANVAVSRKTAGFAIDDVTDLRGHRIIAWRGASHELGAEFELLYAPKGSQRADYVEFANQARQVRAFWAAPRAVAVIDRSIFRYLSEDDGHAMGEVAVHDIFPETTNARVAFASDSLRDVFDEGVSALCASGRYGKILARYDVARSRTVCIR